MKRYAEVQVSGTLSIEVSETLLRGTAAEAKHVDGVFITEVSAALQSDAQIRIWKDTVKIADFDIRHLLDLQATAERQWPSFLELDLDLAAGEILEVGVHSGGTASDVLFLAQYEVR